MTYIQVNMKQFRENWQWDIDNSFFGDRISRCNGKFFTFDGKTYSRLLTDFNIFFTAKDNM